MPARPRVVVIGSGFGGIAAVGALAGRAVDVTGAPPGACGSTARSGGWPGWPSTLVFLVGFRNRVVVMCNWAWNYLTRDRASRVILSDGDPPARDLARDAG